MIRLTRKLPLTLILVVTLLVLLPFLAYKQYEWLGMVSESERERMQENMRVASERFRDDFDREITRVYSAFQNVDADEATLRGDYATRYADWKQTAPYPNLVSDVYLVFESNGPPEVEHLNPSSQQFDKIDWPIDLLPLRTRGTAAFRLAPGVPDVRHSIERIMVISGPVNSKIPAIIIPVGNERPTLGSLVEFRPPFAQVVVKLDLNYIQKEFIPHVVRQYLSAADGTPAYHVAVIDPMTPGRVIYSSGPTSNLQGDVRTSIFASRPVHFRAVLSPLVSASRDIFERRVEGKVSVQIMQRGDAPFTAGLFAESTGSWQLVLTHLAGSLDAAVAQTRQRNLIISFSILLLLALSVGLILISAQRERRLARQQLEFVSAVSHELRTPLSVICSAGENLADGVVRNEEQTRQYGTLVRNEGRRLAEMVEQVLDFAGIQSGRKTYRFESTNAADLIDRSLETFEIQIRDSEVVLEKRIATNLPPIATDRPALVRALQNLISNALKYGERGKWLSVRAESAPDGVNLIVQDRGAGISSVDLPHIFEPFYRGQSAVDAQIKGSGLGLALVKQIVDAHHGRITVNSSPAEGSTFTIYIPQTGPVSGIIETHDEAYSSR